MSCFPVRNTGMGSMAKLLGKRLDTICVTLTMQSIPIIFLWVQTTSNSGSVLFLSSSDWKTKSHSKCLEGDLR